jgi:peptidoglycan/LPS O-acetylase OafA/YrhL
MTPSQLPPPLSRLSYPKYRPEIDGLRALAVSVVVLYHFWPNALNYGYLGVDIFFVISGFLITLYIYEEASIGKFSLKTFYLRRIRRILPATLFVLFFTSISASFILIGIDYERFLKSLIASLTFTSNVYFWRDGGYFGQADSLKPLLHIWSLSAEEQYYFAFPIVFLIILKLTKSFKIRLFAVCTVSLASLLSHVYMIRIGGTNPAFFLTPFRVWEFGVGSIAALTFFQYQRRHTLLSVSASVTLIILGLTLLPIVLVPGLIVVTGTALFLSMAYRRTALLNLFFESSIVRYLGLISFSTYLWHWPLVVFLGYISIDQPNTTSLLSFLVLTYVLSMLTYKFIEQPFRHSINSKKVVMGSFVATFLLLLLAIFVLKINPFKYDENFSSKVASSIQTNYRCNLSDYRTFGASRACLINSKANKDYTLALIGNSHAQMYVPALETYLQTRDEQGLLVTLNACLPTVQLNISSECLRQSKLNLNVILSDKNISTVVVGLTWYSDQLVDSSSTLILDADKARLLGAILDLIDKLEEQGKNVFLIGPLMIPGYDLPSELSRRIKFEGISNEIAKEYLRVDKVIFDSRFGFMLDLFRAKLGDRFIVPTDIFCDSNYCYYGDSGGVYFSDSSHLGSYGVGKVKDLFDVITGDIR